MTTQVFDPILTEAGQAAAFNASNDGIELQLTHVSFGTGHYTPTGAETALVNEVSGKISIAGGSRPTLTQIRMTSVWRAATGTYAIGEVAFWADDILVFVWSKATGEVVGYKTPGVDFVLFNDLGFTQVPAGSINITIDPDASVALAALAAHEGADNAHPQYVRYDVFPMAQINLWAKTVGGTANALVIGLQDGVYVDAYTTGLMIRFKATAANTGPATVNIDGKGVVDIRKSGGDALEFSDIRAGGIYDLIYDGVYFQIAGGVGGGLSSETLEFVATAGQTDFPVEHAGAVAVHQNGRLIPPSSVDLSDPEKVVIAACSAGDDVVIDVMRTFKVADTFSRAESDARFARLSAKNVFTKGNLVAEKPLPATSGTVTIDLAEGNNFGGQITGNIVLANPANMGAGQSGVIRIVNDGVTPRTIAYGSYWKSPAGLMPALTAAVGATDVFGYYVDSASRITLVQQADVK